MKRWKLQKAARKLAICICVFVLLASGYSFACNYAQARSVQSISEKVLRFHVLAESDSADDQRRKLLVRDAVGEWLACRLQNTANRSECEKIIEENRAQIQQLAEQTLAADGKAESVRVQLADVEFPEKTYGDYQFPAGSYRALQIVIGAGAGHNWWCVLYPNLCFSSEGYDVTGDGAREKLTRILSAEEYKLLLKNHNYRFAWKFFK